MNTTSTIRGQFHAIDSFVIRRKGEMHIIGELINGTIEENWFIHVRFNSSLKMTIRIHGIEQIELSSEQKKYILLIYKEENPENLDILFGLHINSEILDISVEGED